jgi:FlhB-like protein
MTDSRQTAVALRYPEDAEAPFITASGKGRLAQKLIDIARKNDIPVVKNDFLVDVLSLEEIGSSIPEETWQVVAKIFAFVIKAEGRNI